MSKIGQQLLRFVQRGGIFVQRGNELTLVPAALLGRFLPRLGRWHRQRPLFFGRLDVPDRLYSAAAR
jgi:hypothetical protein